MEYLSNTEYTLTEGRLKHNGNNKSLNWLCDHGMLCAVPDTWVFSFNCIQGLG